MYGLSAVKTTSTMTRCYSYTRVSTVKQGEKGVSLQEQQAAIERYASVHGIDIVERFEERLTAAKRGRPLFGRMLKKLRTGEAQGVVIHKIDRSARNLRDWAELGDLIDAGVSVHFANESVDLQSRGGRLSADIQAVVAADYVRNLREETLKGIYGRLKQGLYPFGAPVGYLNRGRGEVKAIDPTRGPLIRTAFELYATGRYTLETLGVELQRRGLSNRCGRPITVNGLSHILNNPFYTGLIRMRSTGQTFEGVHPPLVPMLLFKQVQNRLAGRVRSAGWRYDFTFRGLFHCSLCNALLIGETQKGHVYYRCRTRGCPTKCFREERLEQTMLQSWPAIATTEDEKRQLSEVLDLVVAKDRQDGHDVVARTQAALAANKARSARLIDAFVDGTLDKTSFEDRKRALLEEQRTLESRLQNFPQTSAQEREFVIALCELASTAQQSYLMGNCAARREMAIRLCANRSVARKKVSVEPHLALRVLAKRRLITGGDPHYHATRTLVKDAWRLYRWAKRWLKRQGTPTQID
jgi:DNA invertase Pin-like site-specific DNA recombinase